TPEAAKTEHRLRRAAGVGAFQGAAGYKMLFGGLKGLRPAGQRLAGCWHLRTFLEEEHVRSPRKSVLGQGSYRYCVRLQAATCDQISGNRVTRYDHAPVARRQSRDE